MISVRAFLLSCCGICTTRGRSSDCNLLVQARSLRRKASAELTAEAFQSWETNLALDDVDDLVGLGPNDDVAAADQNDLVATPFRIDLDNPRRQRMEANR